jgi:hypothetical protein
MNMEDRIKRKKEEKHMKTEMRRLAEEEIFA